MMRFVKGFSIVAAALLAACGSETKKVTNVIDCKPVLFNTALPAAPPCTVPVNFVVDDTANMLFADAEMQWKGSMKFDPLTRVAFKDSSWSGPFAPLYDDGAWDAALPADRGHEPHGQVKGDHIFGITVFVYPPDTGTESYEYGLIDHMFGDGWMWPSGPNGGFEVAAGATQAITATGLTLQPFGTVDLKLTINVNALDAGFTMPAVTTPVQVKGSGWSWFDIPIYDDGTHGDDTASDGTYTFVLSQYVGAGKLLYHSGLLGNNEIVQFVFAFGPGHLGDANYTEYKVSGAASKTGVAAYTGPAGGPWTAATVGNMGTGDPNTFITTPAP